MIADTFSVEAADVRIHRRQIEHSRAIDTNKIPSIIAAPNSWDAWRHERHYKALLPLVNDVGTEWLTIGDSGADAFWLKKRGVRKITASSLTTEQLDWLGQIGHLDEIEKCAVDAQAIDLPDNSYDYVICKEAYHHFERPALGIYEMLRVSRRAAILLCEPNCSDRWFPLDALKRQLKILLRKNTGCSNPEFEAAGNFIYALSLREATKMATSLQLGTIYYSYLSDFWVPGIVKRKRSDLIANIVMHSAVAIQNLLSTLGLMSWGKITIIVFKSTPPAKLDGALRKIGLRKVEVPRNPYL
ncbi:hypothetical protein GCM10009087_41220 [Sphingomonas oligophenolica]|uniref:Methyltransferase domain-containing protein n=1 Tax=Sphingomonas oligophenolica TaxID=301154 RepID=A0ABU9YCP6_9SPHN